VPAIKDLMYDETGNGSVKVYIIYMCLLFWILLIL
jgi:hypothetical protein